MTLIIHNPKSMYHLVNPDYVPKLYHLLNPDFDDSVCLYHSVSCEPES
jgi:hypothetical protein